MQKIATVTVGAGGVTSVDFTSIPQTYTDLVIYSSARTAEAAFGATIYVQFNGDTTAGNYLYYRLLGDGSAVSSSTGNTYFFAGYCTAATATANTFGSAVCTISNYAGSTIKIGSTDSISENNAASAYAAIHASKWTGTSPITSIKLQTPSGSTFVQYSTFTLYGITKGTGGATAA